MLDSSKMREERTENMTAVYGNKIPKRVPISISLSSAILADYAKVDRKAVYWDPSLLKGALNELSDRIPSDTALYYGNTYTPVSTQTLGAIHKLMSDKGYMQHPNTHCMEDTEYEELSKDPYAFILDKCIPRLYEHLDPTLYGGKAIAALTQESIMQQVVRSKDFSMIAELNEKFGYFEGFGMGGFGRAPMDWIGDQLRSFSGVLSDVRRHRSKLIDALEASYAMCYKIALPPDLNNINRNATTGYQLHMATYLREKDFAEVWLPTWKRMVEDHASLGIRTAAFLEHDWTRLLDYVYDLPTGSVFSFEYTDAKAIKDKLGKKHILEGGFPLVNLTTCTKAEIIDKTKEWLDIMAPGGQYVFSFDKGPLSSSDINIENLIAVCETVRDYGVYDNPGQDTGEIFSKEDYTHSVVPEFKSKYYTTWEKYKEEFPNTSEEAKSVVMGAEDSLLALMFLMTC